MHRAPQRFEPSIQPGFYGRHGRAQDAGNFFELHLFLKTQHEHLAEGWGEPAEAGEHLLRILRGGDFFERGGPLYIADGHHRYETGLAFKAEAQTSVPGAGAILATVTWADDPGLLALPTHRLLAGLDPDLTLEEAETRWSDAFHVEYYPVWDPAPAEQIDALIQQLASSGRAAPSFGVYGLGQLDLFGILELRGRKPPEGALPAERSDAWKSLDVSLLHTLLVDPLVAETGRPREQVLGYTRDAHEAFAEVREGRASVAFFLNPTPVGGVLAVADASDRMPEKSTYFHPKPPAGLVMRDLNTTP